MKKSVPILFTAVILLWNSRALGLQEELSLRLVAGSVYLITGAGCNVVFWATDEGILVADSGEKPNMTEKVLSKIREVSDKPIRYLVFTHYHHIIGAEGFPQSAIVVAQDKTRDNIPLYREILSGLFEKNIGELEQNVSRLAAEINPELKKVQAQLNLRIKQLEDIKRQTDILPQITFENELTIHLGGQRIELLCFGPGHTDGDALVYFPGEKVLYIGDLLYTNGWVPRLDGDAGASVDSWLKIFERVAEMDVEKIVPGHGEAVDRDGFKKCSRVFSEYLTDLRGEVKRYIEQGASLEEMKNVLRLPKYQSMGMADDLLPWNIEGAYRGLMAQSGPEIPDVASYLAETEHLDFRHPVFDQVLAEVTEPGMSLFLKLKALFYFVRDTLPFAARPEDVSFKASEVLTKRRGFCYLKAMAYVALCRKLGIPARLALERFYIRGHLPEAFYHYHGIAAVWYGGSWIYLDTVSNRDSWENAWAKKRPAPFEPPLFRLDGNVNIDSAYIAELKFEDYETNDVPPIWLTHMKEYLRTGKWPD